MPDSARNDASAEARAVAATGLALALVALVAFCSSATPWRTSGATTAASARVLESLGAVGTVALVAAILLVWAGTPPAPPRPRRRRAVQASDFEGVGAGVSAAGKAAAALLLVLGLLLLVALPLSSRPAGSARPPTFEGDAPTASTAGEGKGPGSIDLGWLLLPLGVSLAVLLPVAVVVRRRRFARSDDGEPEPLGDVVRSGIAELESVRDPRQAVLRAYARMEESLAGLEIVRAPDETASELLSRTMRRLSASGEQAGWLTGRFEEARFSTHEIGEPDRERALASLRSIERELAEPRR